MIIDGVKNFTGFWEHNGNVWLTNCELKDAQLVINGDLYVEGPCVFSNTEVRCTGDIIFRVETTIDGDISARYVLTHDVARFGNITCEKILTKGEINFKTLICETARLYGSCFGDRIRANVFWIDGDIIANMIKARDVHVERGSILVKQLEVGSAKADIIGNYSRERLDESILKFKWARPMVDGAEPRTSDSADTILNGFLVLKACIGHIPELSWVLKKYASVDSCVDFSKEKDAIFAAIKKYDALLNPASQQFVDCIERHGFPDLMWRF